MLVLRFGKFTARTEMLVMGSKLLQVSCAPVQTRCRTFKV